MKKNYKKIKGEWWKLDKNYKVTSKLQFFFKMFNYRNMLLSIDILTFGNFDGFSDNLCSYEKQPNLVFVYI